MKVYLVGGAVRDTLLNHPVTERDWVVVGSTPEALLTLGYRPIGRDFPIFLHPTTHEEYALARTERKTGRGYLGFAFYADPNVTLEQDLARRDLTINAMAQDEHGQIIDPYGGKRDIERRILRHVSPAFAEDPVRLLRLARFAARYHRLGFTIAAETLALLQQMVSCGEIDFLTPERVWQELNKALTESDPSVFVEILRACGALKKLFPELDRLFGVPADPKWHPEIDTGIHTLLVLQAATQLTSDPVIRFAALVHDLGKGLTPPTEWPKHPYHEKMGVDLVKELCKRYHIPRQYQELACLVCEYHGPCHRILTSNETQVLDLLTATDAFRRPDRFKQFLLACEADAKGRTGYETIAYPQHAYLEQALAATQYAQIKSALPQGLTGQSLKQYIIEHRLQALKQLISP